MCADMRNPMSLETHMACIVMAYIGMAYIVMAYLGMACIVTAYIVMAYIGMAYIVMARGESVFGGCGRKRSAP